MGARDHQGRVVGEGFWEDVSTHRAAVSFVIKKEFIFQDSDQLDISFSSAAIRQPCAHLFYRQTGFLG